MAKWCIEFYGYVDVEAEDEKEAKERAREALDGAKCEDECNFQVSVNHTRILRDKEARGDA